MTKQILDHRRSGVLLHITSLPNPQPESWQQGSLGSEAFIFADFLAEQGFGVWQMLPVGPVWSSGSPYSAVSVLAGNEALLDWQDLPVPIGENWRQPGLIGALKQAWKGFEQLATAEQKTEFENWLKAMPWVDVYAQFRLIKDHISEAGWWQWPDAYRLAEPEALQTLTDNHPDEFQAWRYGQYVFALQWEKLRLYCQQKDIILFGDIPLFPAQDSVEVWSHPEMFLLDENSQPTQVAGVPPDYFSETGQRWGNPQYNWPVHEQQQFGWWTQRIKTELKRFGLLRIDHFRGLQAVWSIPAHEETAIAGHWVETPGETLLAHLQQDIGHLPFIAEDLGIITDAVDALRQQYHLPGMKILQFAFSGDWDNPYLPAHHEPLSVSYTGTHDNDTALGWYHSLNDETKQSAAEILQCETEQLVHTLIETCLKSPSCLAILPMQDVLGLDTQARMNVPGVVQAQNWHWQMSNHDYSQQQILDFKTLNGQYRNQKMEGCPD